MESFLALLETNNSDKAKHVIRNAIQRIDKTQKDDSKNSQSIEKKGLSGNENGTPYIGVLLKESHNIWKQSIHFSIPLYKVYQRLAGDNQRYMMFCRIITEI